MSLARTSLVIGLAIAACSSRRTDDTPGAPGPARPPSPSAKPASPAPSAPAKPASPAPPADDRYDSGSLGAIAFEVTQGSPEARGHFTRGLLALHSFWYDEATRQFEAAIAADRNMTMAYWGSAMSRCKLL